MGFGVFSIRFGSSAHGGITATTSNMRSPVFVHSSWARSRRQIDTPNRHQHVLDLIEELTLCK